MPNEYPRYRKLELNEEISISMPVGVWLSFTAAYATTEWQCGPANFIAHLIAEALLDPIFLNERLASDQAQMDAQNAAMHRMLGMPFGGFPSTPEGLDDQP